MMSLKQKVDGFNDVDCDYIPEAVMIWKLLLRAMYNKIWYSYKMIVYRVNRE